MLNVFKYWKMAQYMFNVFKYWKMAQYMLNVFKYWKISLIFCPMQCASKTKPKLIFKKI